MKNRARMDERDQGTRLRCTSCCACSTSGRGVSAICCKGLLVGFFSGIDVSCSVIIHILQDIFNTVGSYETFRLTSASNLVIVRLRET